MRFFTLFLCFILFSLTGRAQLCINEFQSSNATTLADEDQDYSDWVEIYNTGGTTLDLSGYSLTDDPTFPRKWVFPQLFIEPEDHVLVFASGKNRRNPPLAWQTIIDRGEDWRYFVPVTDLGTAWHGIGYDDSSWSDGPSGFGYGDGDDATELGQVRCVFIRKTFTLSDPGSIDTLVLSLDYDDAFVAYLNGTEVARSNIGSPGEVTPFDQPAAANHEAVLFQGGVPENFPVADPEDHLVEGQNLLAIQVHNLNAGSTDLSLIPFLSTGSIGGGESEVSPWLDILTSGSLHASFRLDSDGESLYLFDPSGELIDSARTIALPADVAYGRGPDGSEKWYYHDPPTPGTANPGKGKSHRLTVAVTMSPPGGKYPEGVTVTLAGAGGNDSIYYTTDGSVPDSSAVLYTGPIPIANSRVIRARVTADSALPGPVASHTYITGIDHDVPVICLSTDPDNLWNFETGIFAYGPHAQPDYPYFNANFWMDWERPVHVEFYDTGGKRQIDQDAGMKVYGAWSRAVEQKSVALFARKAYGKGSFQYSFFADKPIDRFESIVLRNSGNDNLGLQFHDCFMTGLTRNMELDRQAFQPAAVYINGGYWGLLNIREKISEHFIASNHQVPADSVNLLETYGWPVHGSNTRYMELTAYLNETPTLQQESDFARVAAEVDLDNFIQYQLTQIYLNNRDWPANNMKFWNSRLAESKWRWIIYDTDFGFGLWNTEDYKLNTLEFALATDGPGWPNPPWATLFLRRMVTHPGFRNNFIIQFCDRLNLDFHPSRVASDLDSLKQLYRDEMVHTFNRWWGNIDEWQWRINNLKIYGNYRPHYCREHMQEIFGLDDVLTVRIEVSDREEGYVKLNTIIPETPFTGYYFRNIPISLKAIPRPGYKFVQWTGSVYGNRPDIAYNMSAPGEFRAVFAKATPEERSVAINEIKYQSAPDRNTKDWIELVNNGVATVDLGGWLLTDGDMDSGYVFPAKTWLAPGDYIVICRDQESFRYFHPGTGNLAGELPFGLSSAGESLLLYDAERQLMDVVNYRVQAPWPILAPGSGASIELIHPVADNGKGENWKANLTGGTPGITNSMVEDPGEPPIPEGLNPVLDCFPNPFSDYTTIRFEVPANGHYRLEVVDMQGRLVALLADHYLEAGAYWIDWSGNEGSGPPSGAGIYHVRLSGSKNLASCKIVKLP